MRTAEIKRKTGEVDIKIKVNLDGQGKYDIKTPNGFLTHMLELLSKHSCIDMEIDAKGDTEVDLHHTMEDTGIALGEAIAEALGDKKGIERYASVMMVMDEVRVDVALDIGGRGKLIYRVNQLDNQYDKEKGFDYSLIKEFIEALSTNMKVTLHINHYTPAQITQTENKHHIAEAIFKGLARSLKQAVKVISDTIPSTKGVV